MSLSQGFNNQRIVVISANELTPKVKEQIDKLRKKPLQLEERKLAVFTLIDGEVTSIFNVKEDSKYFVENNISSFTTSSSFQTFLIGLDQSIKQKYLDIVEPKILFEIIDSMPMRQAEMKKN